MTRDDLGREYPYGDVGQLIAFILFLLIWIIDSFIFRLSTILADYLPLYLQLILAATFFALAGFLVRSTHVVLFKEMRNPPQVISTGVFSRVRHPMYLGVILFYLGLFFTTLSLLSLVFLVVIFLFYDHIASFEEKQLEQKFGKEYIDYKEKTPKWLPRLRP
jgi:protein-S-isoprenylcysteine O-methyltransferase Ste14